MTSNGSLDGGAADIELLTTAQVARLMGVKPRRVIDLCASNRIRGARKVGRDWVIPARTGLVVVEPTPTQAGPRLVQLRPVMEGPVETRAGPEFQVPPEEKPPGANNPL